MIFHPGYECAINELFPRYALPPGKAIDFSRQFFGERDIDQLCRATGGVLAPIIGIKFADPCHVNSSSVVWLASSTSDVTVRTSSVSSSAGWRWQPMHR